MSDVEVIVLTGTGAYEGHASLRKSTELLDTTDAGQGHATSPGLTGWRGTLTLHSDNDAFDIHEHGEPLMRFPGGQEIPFASLEILNNGTLRIHVNGPVPLP
ncbi:hypothetical protein ACFYPT_38925 [Streptomyces sp. NPDC005529]|uniref:hypothetical protein n=1 Tax=unclassified Streptomyces TaxID=2593676 RepID=UPI0033AE9261